MDKIKDIGKVEKSLKRCLSNEGFLSQFYFELCNIHPTAYCHLAGPDLENYKENLNAILWCLIDFGKGKTKCLTSIRDKEFGLNEETISYWEQALLLSITANDKNLDHELSAAWRSLIKSGLSFMLSQKSQNKAA